MTYIRIEQKAAISTRDLTEYVIARTALTARHTEALAGRLRGVVKTEQRAVERLLGLRKARGDIEVNEPTLHLLLELLGKSKKEIERLLGDHLEATSTAASINSFRLVGLAERPSYTATQEYLVRLLRSHVVPAARYLLGGGTGGQPLSAVFGAIAGGQIGARQAQQLLAKAYGETFARCESVARTEVSWAASMAEREIYLESGWTEYTWYFGGGPCGTGICADLDGQVAGVEGFGSSPIGGTFGNTVSTPPAHPNCTCCLLPGDCQTDVINADLDDYAVEKLGTGGFSRVISTGEEPVDGFMVSDYGASSPWRFSQGPVQRSWLSEYRRLHADRLAEEHVFWGGWTTDSSAVLDVSRQYKDRAEAFLVAIRNRQTAFYDVAANGGQGAEVMIPPRILLARGIRLQLSRPEPETKVMEPRTRFYLPRDAAEAWPTLVSVLRGEGVEVETP